HAQVYSVTDDDEDEEADEETSGSTAGGQDGAEAPAPPFLPPDDQDEVRGLMTEEEFHQRVQEWADDASEYGEEDPDDPDLLQEPTQEEDDQITREGFEEETLQDEVLAPLWRHVHGETPAPTCREARMLLRDARRTARYRMRDGFLTRVEDNRYRIVVPLQLREWILRGSHEARLAGHPGA